MELLLEETWERPYTYDPWTGFRERPRAGRFVNIDPAGFRRAPDGVGLDHAGAQGLLLRRLDELRLRRRGRRGDPRAARGAPARALPRARRARLQLRARALLLRAGAGAPDAAPGGGPAPRPGDLPRRLQRGAGPALLRRRDGAAVRGAPGTGRRAELARRHAPGAAPGARGPRGARGGLGATALLGARPARARRALECQPRADPVPRARLWLRGAHLPAADRRLPQRAPPPPHAGELVRRGLRRDPRQGRGARAPGRRRRHVQRDARARDYTEQPFVDSLHYTPAVCDLLATFIAERVQL